MDLKYAQKKNWEITYRSKCLESMSSDTLLAFHKEIHSFLEVLNKKDENNPDWKELQCNMLAMEYFVVTQYNMLTKGDYFPGMFEDDCLIESPEERKKFHSDQGGAMNRKRLEEVASEIDIEECLSLPDKELYIEILKEIKSMFDGLEEHAFTGRSKKHPLLNDFDDQKLWTAINFVYDCRTEFDLLKNTNKNPDIVAAQLAMEELWKAFGSEEYRELSDEEEERFLQRVESFHESIKEIDSPSYDLKRLDMDCRTICSIIMMNQNIKNTGKTGLEDYLDTLESKRKKVG